ncbi:Cytochrome b5 like Heme Steroid binding domain [Trypanosoma vivax]|uniref:Cytochrome b5 heme-binding domain-containing protein n=1 Tax=Trypanosoma vivax (strain Y486) TaxID=1055687 RepID=G0TU37_TRYVY|nr:hypothetical protein TRVL_00159 [Trypanosoma vivax]KAH8613715.1 Cytochrome b5 like Heme Steroid binding domain [Trypanosoma vivax]CCC47471.1 conserved hypothetical protein [Trypanosoma vivax Y486]
MQLSDTALGAVAVAFIALMTLKHMHILDRFCSTTDASGAVGASIRPVEPIKKQAFNAESLSVYDGVQNRDIYVSVKETVYEVAPQFYGPGESYHVYAGKEISRCLAKCDLTGTEANKHWLPGTSQEELGKLEKWVSVFETKYPVVGWFVWDEEFNGL